MGKANENTRFSLSLLSAPLPYSLHLPQLSERLEQATVGVA